MTGPEASNLARLRCGTSVLNADWHHVNAAVPTTCPHCPDAAETAEHFLVECPHWAAHRTVMYNSIDTTVHVPGIGTPLPWTTLLGGQELTRNGAALHAISTAVQQFIRSTGRLRQKPPYPDPQQQA